MCKKYALVIVVILLVLSSGTSAQEKPTVYFESWDTDYLRDQKFTFNLDSSSNLRSEFVRRWNGSGYRLTLTRVPEGHEEYQLEYWRVELNEVFSKPGKKEELGTNLLLREPPGKGKHVFWREDWVGDLFPRENPTRMDLLLRGQYYPVFAKRVIKVKSFYVVIEVKDFRMNRASPKKLDSMTVDIEFTSQFPCANSQSS